MHKIIFLQAILALISIRGFAKHEAPHKMSLAQQSLVVGDSVHVQADTSSYLDSINSIYHINNYITFKLYDFTSLCPPDSFECSVGIRIKQWDKFDHYIGYKDTVLTVSFNKRIGASFTERNTWKLENLYRISATITSISCGSAILDYLELEAELQVEWYPNMTTLTGDVPTGLTLDSVVDSHGVVTYKASWTPLAWAEEYDLEWMFIDDYDSVLGLYKDVTLLETSIFNNRATRVTISGNSYNFNPNFEHGYLCARIRAVGRHIAYPDHRVNCDWDSFPCFHIINPHERVKNWQYVAVFAEEGKHKEVITYMDGTMRKRQTTTQNNSDSMSVVGETIYDKEGRAAIQFMPVPAFSSRLGYYSGFNLNHGMGTYNDSNFHVRSSITCQMNMPDSVSSTIGAGKYYSSRNTLAGDRYSNFHAYLPNADGYPFAQTEYTRDNTGRVSRQGGPGVNHILGSGHETQYFYETPDQEELVSLFGTNVGNYEHYKKNTVVDANGQYSISYMNPKGQVVATSLAGGAPSNVQSLASLTSPKMVREDLSGSGLTIEQGSYSRELDRSWVVTDNHTFHKIFYKLPIPKKSSCLPSGTCFFAVYNLEIILTDGCNDTLFKVVRKLGDDGGYIDTLCAHGPKFFHLTTSTPGVPADSFSMDGDSISFYLKKGQYTLKRRISVDMAAADAFAELYSKRNTCQYSQAYFDSLYLAQMDTSECHPTCQTCRDKIGSLDSFIVKFFRDNDRDTAWAIEDTLYAKAFYNQQLETCDDLCDTASPCNTLLKMMEMDVSPGGQYFMLHADTVNGDTVLSPTEYFNVGYSAYFKSDEVGLSEVPVFIGDSVKQIKDLTEQEFIMNFNPAWAKNLARLHPEYCKYKTCLEQNDTSDFLNDFLATTTCKEAIDKGYMNPMGLDSLHYTVNRKDPLFDSITQHHRFLLIDSLLSHLYLIPRTSDSVYVNLYRYIYMPTISNIEIAHLADTLKARYDQQGICNNCNDEVWATFKAIYFRARCKAIDIERADSCPYTIIPGGKRKLNNSESDINDALGISGKTNSQIKTQVIGQMKGFDSSICVNYADDWMFRLKGCFTDSVAFYTQDTSYQRLRDSLIAVCRRGSDYRNPYGSTTVSPIWQKRTPPINKSFSDVIKNWNNARYKRGVCDELLVDYPMPYGHDYFNTGDDGTTRDIPDTAYAQPMDNCTCEKLGALQTRYGLDSSTICKAKGFTAWVNAELSSSFTDSQLIKLMMHCGKSYYNMQGSGYESSCDDTVTIGDTSLSGVYIPAALRCPTPCLSCQDIVIGASKFVNLYRGLPDTSQLLRELFANYMNQSYGYNLNYLDYMKFLENCDSGYQYLYGFNYRTIDTIKLEGDVSTLPHSQKYFVSMEWECHRCAKMLSYWADYKELMFKGQLPAGTTFTQYMAQKHHYPVPFEPNDETIEALIGKCAGLLDTTVLIDSTSLCRCVKVGGGFQDYDCSAPYPNPPCESGGVPYSWRYHIKYSLLDSILQIHKVGYCSNSDDHGYGTCDSFLSYLDSLGSQTLAYRERSLEKHYKHDFTILEYKYPSYGGNLDTTILTICNEPTQYAYNFLELMNLIADRKLLTDSSYIAVDSFATYKESLFKQTPDARFYFKPIRYNWKNYAQSTTGLSRGMDIFIGPDTTTSCKVRLDSLNTYNVSTIIAFAYIRPLAVQQQDGTQRFGMWAFTSSTDSFYITGSTKCFPIAECCPSGSIGQQLCNRSMYFIPPADTITCAQHIRAQTLAKAANAFTKYQDSIKNAYKFEYLKWAMDSLNWEQFKLMHQIQQYHYTLYYYDQAGNLVQTVPPKGVARLDSRDVDSVIKYLSGPSYKGYYKEPPHTLVTQYRYNSLNQVVWQSTPDGGESQFWYDELGRMVASQNNKQRGESNMSYTFYDQFGRINEVGQFSVSSLPSLPDEGMPWDYVDFVTDVKARTREQITATYYDLDAMYTVGSGNGRFQQAHLRNRVSAIITKPSPSADTRTASLYSYDLHGNVNNLLQYNQAMADVGQEYKQIDYEYDLVSGKVNKVIYQWNESDAMYHKYTYDADNRIIMVETSRDSVIWDHDANYKYYLHGPLARTELLPDHKLQGLDYYYTIQGWLKGVNAPTLDSSRDPGHDNYALGSQATNAKDVFGFELSYYTASGSLPADYVGVGTTTSAGNQPFTSQAGGSGLLGQAQSLFNGNIRAMTTGISKFMENSATPIAFAYNYDQLNRLIQADAFNNINLSTNTWQSGSPLSLWHNRFSYDANGNILTQVRRGNSPLAMDSLSYNYTSGSNKLSHVDDNTGYNSNYTDDIDDQILNNYKYDSIGNLVHDSAEEIDSITWSVYGKILEIKRFATSLKPDLAFEYGPDGNRVTKLVKAKNDSTPWQYTFYVRDAQGNVMATYNRQTTKRIQYGSLTFVDLNNRIIADKGSSDWQGFMGTDSIATDTFKNRYLKNMFDNSQFPTYMATSLMVTTYIVSDLGSSAFYTHVSSEYATSELEDALRSYIGKYTWSYYVYTLNFSSFILSTVSMKQYEFLNEMYANDYSNFYTMYSYILGYAPSGGLPYDITDLSTYSSDVYNWLLANYVGSFSGIFALMSDSDVDDVIEPYISTLIPGLNIYDLINSLIAYDNTRLCGSLFSYKSSDDWVTWFNTNYTSASSYALALANFPLYAGYTQDAGNYYNKEKYINYVGDYFGSTYRDLLMETYMPRVIHYEDIDFAGINTRIINELNFGNWFSFMSSSKVETPQFKQDYIAKIFDNSLGGDFLYNTGLVDLYYLYPTFSARFHATFALYNNSQILAAFRGNYGKSTTATNIFSCLTYNPCLDEALSYHKSIFLSTFYGLNSTSYDNMYFSVTGNASPGLPNCITDLMSSSGYDLLISSWFTSNLTSSVFRDIISYFSDSDFDDVLITGLTGNNFQSCFEAAYSVTDMVPTMWIYDLPLLCSYTVSSSSTIWGSADWAAWFLSYDSATSYTTALTYYPSTASEIQTANGYYTKEEYMGYVKDFFGNSDYELVLDSIPQGQYFAEDFKLDELYLYGSSRLGSINANMTMISQKFNAVYSYLLGEYNHKEYELDSSFEPNLYNKVLVRSMKRYELSNHLGNVLVVISDQWRTHCDSVAQLSCFGCPATYTYISYYEATVIQATDYYPFGSVMKGRECTDISASSGYRFSFNGKEKDNETDLLDYGMRIYNSALGKFLTVDPLTKGYPMLTPYQFASNTPIQAIDMDGNESKYAITNDADGNPVITITNTIYLVNKTKGESEVHKQLKTVGTFYPDQVATLNDGSKVTIKYNTVVVPVKNTLNAFFKIIKNGGNLVIIKNKTGSTNTQEGLFGLGLFPFKTARFYTNMQKCGAEVGHELGHVLGLGERYLDPVNFRTQAESMTDKDGKSLPSPTFNMPMVGGGLMSMFGEGICQEQTDYLANKIMAKSITDKSKSGDFNFQIIDNSLSNVKPGETIEFYAQGNGCIQQPQKEANAVGFGIVKVKMQGKKKEAKQADTKKP